MPPRLDPNLISFQNGERQGLMSHPIEGADHDDGDPNQQPLSFWEAIRQRRQNSDQKAATDASNVERRQRNRCKALFLGQFIALVAASVNVTSFTLENRFHVIAPMTLLFMMYIFLSLHLLFRSRDYRPSDSVYRMPLLGFRLRIPWYLYFFFSLIDVGAGVILLLSLQYTSLTSVTLLGSLTVPSTMIFSKFLLGKSFHSHHFVGVCLCLAGGCLTIWSDLDDNSTTNGSSAVNDNAGATTSFGTLSMNGGDLMAVSAALMYGLGDAVSEYSIKHLDRMEFLGMMGLFGMMLTGLQLPFQEGDVLKMLFSDPGANRDALLLMASYVSLLLLYYVTEAYFLVSSDATLLNLSLQAQNLWAILFSVMSLKAAPPVWFFLSVVFVFTGVACYEIGASSDPVVQLVSSDRTPQDHGNQEDMREDLAAVPTKVDGGNKRKQEGVKYSSIQQIEII